MLGSASDGEVAELLGLPKHCVRYKRRCLQIPPAREASPSSSGRWSQRRVALVGTAPDPEIARRLGVHPGSVAYQRRKRGVPPFRPRPKRHPVTAELVAALGRASDNSVARRFGVSVPLVTRERERRAIALYPDDRKIVRSKGLVGLLRLPASEIRRLAGISRRTVAVLRKELGLVIAGGPRSLWTPDAVSRLGRVSDAVLARQLGCHLETVRAKRRSLGMLKRSMRRWTPQEEARLWQGPLELVARRLGRTVHAVRQRRLLVSDRDATGPGKKPRPRAWTREEDAGLWAGTAAEVAQRLGRTPGAVAQRRHVVTSRRRRR